MFSERGSGYALLYVLVLALIIMAITPSCVRKRPPSVSIEAYEFHCRNLSDNERIAEFYRVDMGLQEALDELRQTEMNWTGRGFIGGLFIGRATARVKQLRMQKATVLTIIHQRGLTLPVPVK
jgi:hypothetical protein